MTRMRQIAKLGQISQLLLDSRLATLQIAARACRESEDRLAGLTVPDARPGALPEIAALMASLNYQRWADVRRGEINLLLARQTSAMIEARDAAREAFGRVEALRALQKRET